MLTAHLDLHRWDRSSCALRAGAVLVCAYSRRVAVGRVAVCVCVRGARHRRRTLYIHASFSATLSASTYAVVTRSDSWMPVRDVSESAVKKSAVSAMVPFGSVDDGDEKYDGDGGEADSGA